MQGTPGDGTDGWTAALLVGPARSDAVDDHCHDLLAVEGATDAHVLLVSYTESADRRLARWESHVGDLAHHVEVIGVGDSPRAAAGTNRGKIRSPEGDVTVSYASPSDLTGIGIRISECLAEWRRDSPDGSSFLVCFDSLTALLQYVSLERAFRFVHILAGRLRAEGARAHFHLDPNVHDEQTVAALTTLFDVVFDVTEG